MKITKKIISVLIIIFMGIINVKATNNDFDIEDIKIEDKNETIKVINPTYKDNNVESTIEFNKVGDYVKYKIILKNNDDKIYKIKKIEDNNESDYISISYDYKNEEINPNTQFEIYVTYKIYRRSI